jgi:predicted phage terminase large subunit-like protein
MTKALNQVMKAIADAKKIKALRQSMITAHTVINPYTSLSIMDLIPALNPTYQAPYHLKPMIDKLEESWLRPVRMTIAAPVQHGKSSTLIAYIVATLLRDPTKRIVYVTYSHTIAQDKGREIRNMARLAGLNIAVDADRQGEFKLKEGGGVFCTSIEGSLTGRPLDIIIVDDAVKNRGQARSGTWQRICKDFYNDILETRARATVTVIIQMARWSTNDLLGMILDGTLGSTTEQKYKYEHIYLPAIKEDDEPLWPEQWTKEKLEGLKSDVISWNSLFMCRPLSDGAEIFSNQVVYFKQGELPVGLVKAIGVDLAYTTAKSADSSVAICVGRDGLGVNAKYYVLDMIAMQTSAPIFATHLKSFQSTHNPTTTRIDAGGTEKGAISFMTDHGPNGLALNLQVVNATVDKVSRALPLSRIWNEHRLYVPSDKSWSNQLTEQLIGFTGSGLDHDDIVDALSSAINALADNQFQGSGITSTGARGSDYTKGYASRPKAGWRIGA